MKKYDYVVTFHNQEKYSENPAQLNAICGSYLDSIKGTFGCEDSDGSITGELIEV